MADALSHSVPVFKLYGEQQLWPTPDLLHCELIRERSGPHDWHIPAHRHADLMHLLYIRRGEGQFHLEGRSRAISGPNILAVPSMAIHGFDFERDTDGYAITLAKPLIEYLAERLGIQGEVLNRGAQYSLSGQPERESIEALVAQLHDAYRRPDAGRAVLMHALIQALTVQLARRAERKRAFHAPSQDRGYQHFVNFQRLVAEHFKDHCSVSELAQQLGITATHLNTLCQRLAGIGALGMLHERKMLEAKRLLTYTNLTISQVSDELGFSEPAYFSRFFKRHSGQSPRHFRQRDLAQLMAQ